MWRLYVCACCSRIGPIGVYSNLFNCANWFLSICGSLKLYMCLIETIILACVDKWNITLLFLVGTKNEFPLSESCYEMKEITWTLTLKLSWQDENVICVSPNVSWVLIPVKASDGCGLRWNVAVNNGHAFSLYPTKTPKQIQFLFPKLPS